MKNQMVTASGRKSGMKKRLKHIMIEPSANKGFTVTAHHQRPEEQEMAMAKGGPYQPEPEPESAVFEDSEGMMNHVGKMVGHKMPKAPAKQPVRDDEDAKEEAAEEKNEKE